MYDVDDERYLNPDNKSYRDLLSDNLYLEEKLQELEEEYDELEDRYYKLKDIYKELEDECISLKYKYASFKERESKMIQLIFDNKTLEQENKELKEKYNILINKLQVQEND